MKDSILQFAQQFSYVPEISNQDKLEGFGYDHIILAGMGGSHLPADLLKAFAPGLDIYVHRDYDLPPYSDDFMKRGLLIASSYSGNTEEVVSFYDAAKAKGYKVAALSTGGALIERATTDEAPYIQMPDTGVQPRMALGIAMIALTEFLPESERKAELKERLASMQEIMKPEEQQEKGEELAKLVDGKAPVIYASNQNLTVAYNWKIKINETGKVPAFYNIFPELNHNEMQGFGVEGPTAHFAEKFHVFFVEDADDHERVQKRMSIARALYEKRGISTTVIKLEGESRVEKVLKALNLADWIALSFANLHGAEPEQVPMIEDFKKILNS